MWTGDQKSEFWSRGSGQGTWHQPTDMDTNSHPVNSLAPEQNSRHFADSIFKCICMNEKFCISLRISLPFVPKDPIDNKPALVQVMAWHQC